MRSNQTKFFGIIIIAVYLLIPILFFQNIAELGSHHHMASLSDCPYMDGVQAICPIDFTFYSGIFNLITTIHVDDLKIFVLILSLGVLGWFIYQKIQFFKPNIYFKNQRRRSISDIYQILFSQGILNPKPY